LWRPPPVMLPALAIRDGESGKRRDSGAAAPIRRARVKRCARRIGDPRCGGWPLVMATPRNISDDECDRTGGMFTHVPAWAADCDWARESVAA